eukprot:gnl/MRDRNA2_/MRDRNA2_56060_c0_seq1.p1 gnl/MRDRNA2_/MRDRNA2_56060_c0~~gnl/MRDRNA2_/MRDRNA2_56060_c0_seq1.p1  ORF type:complete len:219 (+),score=56.35 gnl/MRDRNA2_/MRDRNA2_56060_c0_seq1:120-776(+)
MKLECLVVLAGLPFGESGIFGFHVRKPPSGFLGDRPELPKMSEPQRMQFDQDEFKAMYKKPRVITTKTEQFTSEMDSGNTSAIRLEQASLKKENTNTSSGLKTPMVEKDIRIEKKNSSDTMEKKPRRKPTSREEKLIESLKGMEGDAAVGCVTHCRYGEEVRHTWQECLNRCVENGPMRSIMESMLPAEHHAPPSMDAEVPSTLRDHLKRHRDRSEEL